MSMAKKKSEGKAQRRRLIDAYFGNEIFQSIRSGNCKKDVADDDINDALAALWTAERILEGKAQRIPEMPPNDSCGLRMEMWY